ncbi:hypothetical protein DFQ27_001812, partial [Actinomortierella ambigua]
GLELLKVEAPTPPFHNTQAIVVAVPTTEPDDMSKADNETTWVDDEDDNSS